MLNKIDRCFLWQKLINKTVSLKLIKAIKSMYTSINSKIRYKYTKSEYIKSKLGVKQRDPYSSLWCLIP